MKTYENFEDNWESLEKKWKTMLRKQLNIDTDVTVYISFISIDFWHNDNTSENWKKLEELLNKKTTQTNLAFHKKEIQISEDELDNYDYLFDSEELGLL